MSQKQQNLTSKHVSQLILFPNLTFLENRFEARNCVVLGCSTDTKHSHKGWKLLPKEFEKKSLNVQNDKSASKFNFKRLFSTKIAVEMHYHQNFRLGGIGDLNYPLLADPTKKVAKAYDVLEAGGDVCVRGVFLLNKEGEVFVEHKNADPIGRNLDEVLRVLDGLIFHEESVAKGNKQVCPANWKLGLRTFSTPKSFKFE